MRVRIRPATPLATASGLMIASVRSIIFAASLPEHLRDGRAHVGGAPDERGSRFRQRGHLLRRRALAPRDDGARVAHAPAGRRETTPTGPGVWMCPGMMPTFAAPGVMTPGQFGPTRRVGFSAR